MNLKPTKWKTIISLFGAIFLILVELRTYKFSQESLITIFYLFFGPYLSISVVQDNLAYVNLKKYKRVSNQKLWMFSPLILLIITILISRLREWSGSESLFSFLNLATILNLIYTIILLEKFEVRGIEDLGLLRIMIILLIFLSYIFFAITTF